MCCLFFTLTLPRVCASLVIANDNIMMCELAGGGGGSVCDSNEFGVEIEGRYRGRLSCQSLLFFDDCISFLVVRNGNAFLTKSNRLVSLQLHQRRGITKLL
jgi:hypothetical protein